MSDLPEFPEFEEPTYDPTAVPPFPQYEEEPPEPVISFTGGWTKEQLAEFEEDKNLMHDTMVAQIKLGSTGKGL